MKLRWPWGARRAPHAAPSPGRQDEQPKTFAAAKREELLHFLEQKRQTDAYLAWCEAHAEEIQAEIVRRGQARLARSLARKPAILKSRRHAAIVNHQHAWVARIKRRRARNFPRA